VNAWESKSFEVDAKETGEFRSFLLELSQGKRLTNAGQWKITTTLQA
jgi:hypothetical protein